jgi:hypothetical protein
LDGASIVVKPEAARRQIEEDRKRAADDSGSTTPDKDAGITEDKDVADEEGTDGVSKPPSRLLPLRFYGRITLEPVRLLRDVNNITDAIVQQLGRASNAQVSVTVEIEATSTDGFDDDIRRTVTENARTLRFDTHEFESE